MLPGTDGSDVAHPVGAVAARDLDPDDVLNYGLHSSDPPDRMYMAGGSNNALYSIDSDDFTAQRVSASVSAFGVGETEPTGTAWHNGRLYMIGAVNDALYTLNPDTGEAAYVDSGVIRFGVDENRPQGLASHNGELYMLGDATDALYRLDPATGAAERVGNVKQFGQSWSDPAALASFGEPSELYALFSDTATVYRLDTATGGVDAAGTEYTLYASVSDGLDVKGALSSAVDDTAVVTVRVENVPPAFTAHAYQFELTSGSDGRSDPVVLGTPPTTDPEDQTLTYSLRSSDPAERMYMVGGTAQALYALDSTKGTVARVGDAALFGVSEISPRSLAWHNGQLYMIGGSSGHAP